MRYEIFAFLALAFTSAVAIDARAAAPNLVVNGNFDSGNIGFISDYVYSPSANNAEGQYTVGSYTWPWNQLFISAQDHTSGSGLMYVGNGSATNGAIVWQSQAFNVAPNTDYFFEAFVMNVCCAKPFPGNTPSILEFSVSGVSLGTVTTDLALAGTWEGLSRTWNSGATTSVVLSLINRNTAVAGNDFAIDDIYFGTQTTLVPEPASWALMGVGLFGLLGTRRRAAKLLLAIG
jgi:hypothetical protein